ncbi:acyl-ACP thioesterase [Xaviernesmea oryzae]|uniref:Acyl-CoA thioester hydrolase n=1 Tax=Xaviernesmea oryzae TaxID=464029 RepID=A0A1X7DJZ4_9HYPH|nr:acyl-ACP thioesterase [Xaviernesmea oryzae]SMF16939.1 acyl-CoA thioester hydrolase [Xaviernesmea oryzae]
MSGGMAGSPMIEVWRGSARQWEVDEMGHWNTQYYVARANEGLAILFGFNGLPGLFSPGSATTVAFNEHHIRFHREAHAGAPLHMTGGFLEIGEATAFAVLVLYHSETGQVAATFRVRVTHVHASDGVTSLPWPAAFREKAFAALVETPKEAAPRGTNDAPVAMTASRERAVELSLKRTAMSLIERDSCDAFGRMGPQKFIGAVGGGVKQLTGPLRALVAELAETPPGKVGGAVLEFRIVYGDCPRLGDCFEIWAGLEKTDKRTMSLIFWMVDPFNGRVFGSMQSVAIVFDLDARAIVEISPAATKALTEHVTKGLAL